MRVAVKEFCLTHAKRHSVLRYEDGRWSLHGAELERLAGDQTREPLQTLVNLLNSRLVKPVYFRIVSRALSVRGVFEHTTYRKYRNTFADAAVEEICWGSIFMDGEEKEGHYLQWENDSCVPLALECIRSGARETLEYVIMNNPRALTADAILGFIKTGRERPNNYGQIHSMNRAQRMRLVRKICEWKNPPAGALFFARAALGCGVHEWTPHLIPLSKSPLEYFSAALQRRDTEDGHPYDIYIRDMCVFHPLRVDDPEGMAATAVEGRTRAAALLRADWERHRSPVLSYNRDRTFCQTVVPAGSAKTFGVQRFRGVGWWEDIEAHPFGSGEAWIVRPSSTLTGWDPMRMLFGKYRMVEEEWD